MRFWNEYILFCCPGESCHAPITACDWLPTGIDSEHLRTTLVLEITPTTANHCQPLGHLGITRYSLDVHFFWREHWERCIGYYSCAITIEISVKYYDTIGRRKSRPLPRLASCSRIARFPHWSLHFSLQNLVRRNAESEGYIAEI